MDQVRRGYVPKDVQEFNKESIGKLLIAQRDLLYLLEHGYPIKSASTFVGNHFMLSERQRLAIVRATAEHNVLQERKKKQRRDDLSGETVYLDGLNIIITLEVALSESTLIHCMDGTLRDLAGLRGTYRLIDKTDVAIRLIGDKLEQMKVNEVIIYLDSPVSNTGRLKHKILEMFEDYQFKISVELVNNADVILEKLPNVITSDAIILNKCQSWINLTAEILRDKAAKVEYIDLSNVS